MTSVITIDTEHREATERFHDSASGMRATARDLRSGAREMSDSNDRDAMLRLAANQDRRANEIERRIKARA